MEFESVLMISPLDIPPTSALTGSSSVQTGAPETEASNEILIWSPTVVTTTLAFPATIVRSSAILEFISLNISPSPPPILEIPFKEEASKLYKLFIELSTWINLESI